MTKILMPTGEFVNAEIPKWKTPYNHDTNIESDRVALFCKDPSLTKQEFKEETDINVLLERFQRSGETPPMVLPEHFADLTGRTTHFEMASRIAEANTMFYLLPAEKRAVYLNDPTRWADAVVKAVETGNRQELTELGIEVPEPRPQEPAAPQHPQGGPPAPAAGTAAPGASQGAPPPSPPSDNAPK